MLVRGRVGLRNEAGCLPGLGSAHHVIETSTQTAALYPDSKFNHPTYSRTPQHSFLDEPWELTSFFTSDPQADETAHLGQTEKNRGPAHLDSGRA